MIPLPWYLKANGMQKAETGSSMENNLPVAVEARKGALVCLEFILRLPSLYLPLDSAMPFEQRVVRPSSYCRLFPDRRVSP